MDCGGNRGLVAGCAALLVAASASAGPKMLVVATGDCRNAELLTGASAFHLAMKAQLKGDLLEPDVLLDTLRPRPSRSVDDIKRQVDLARTLFYGGQYDRCADVLKQALGELARVSPLLKPWETTAEALALDALESRQLGKKEEFAQAFRRILRLDPAAKLDPDLYTPSVLAAFEGVRKELARARKTTVTVASTPTGADVFIDGRPMGTTPVKLELVPGSYTLALTRSDSVSFVRPFTLKAQPQDFQVDLGFEGAVSTQLPLCVTSELNDLGSALKLGAAASADRVAVFWLASRTGDPPNYSVTVFASGRQERAASIVPPRRDHAALSELAAFVTTGEAARGIVPAGLARPGLDAPPAAPSTAPAVVARPAEAPPAAKEPPPRPREPARDAPTADTASPAPAAAVTAPPPEPPPAVQASMGPPRLAAWVLGGAGLALAAGGGVLYAVGGADRAALEALKDSSGKLPLPGTPQSEQAALLTPRVDGNRLGSLALVGAGVGALAAGAVLFFAFPATPVAVGAAPTPGGAVVSLAGTF